MDSKSDYPKLELIKKIEKMSNVGLTCQIYYTDNGNFYKKKPRYEAIIKEIFGYSNIKVIEGNQDQAININLVVSGGMGSSSNYKVNNYSATIYYPIFELSFTITNKDKTVIRKTFESVDLPESSYSVGERKSVYYFGDDLELELLPKIYSYLISFMVIAKGPEILNVGYKSKDKLIVDGCSSVEKDMTSVKEAIERKIKVLLEPKECDESITYFGKRYNIIPIVDKCWLKENLNVGTKINGNDLQEYNKITEKYCYDNKEENCDKYGGLYQWDEAMQYVKTAGAKGICPTGWHIPTKSEFEQLKSTVSENSNALKSVGQGRQEIQGGKVLQDGKGRNTSGYSALLSGYRNTNGTFTSLGSNANFWSSSELTTPNAFYMYLYDFDGDVSLSYGYKDYGFSVRCVQD